MKAEHLTCGKRHLEKCRLHSAADFDGGIVVSRPSQSRLESAHGAQCKEVMKAVVGFDFRFFERRSGPIIVSAKPQFSPMADDFDGMEKFLANRSGIYPKRVGVSGIKNVINQGQDPIQGVRFNPVGVICSAIEIGTYEPEISEHWHGHGLRNIGVPCPGMPITTLHKDGSKVVGEQTQADSGRPRFPDSLQKRVVAGEVADVVGWSGLTHEPKISQAPLRGIAP